MAADKYQRQIEKAIEWCERKSDEVKNLTTRVRMASWRFNVDEADLLNAYRKFKGACK